MTTGFSFKKDDSDDQNSRYTLNVYKSAPVSIPNDENDKSPKKLISYKIDDLPFVVVSDNTVRRSDQMKELLSSNQQIADTIERILEKEVEEISVSSEPPLASTHRPSPIPFVIQNLPEPGQKPIVIQLKAQTGPRTHGPRIGSGEVVPLYSRPINRAVESLHQNFENQPVIENIESNNDNEKNKTVPKVYLKTVIKRPLTPNIKTVADNKESDSIFSFLRQPFRSRSTNSDTSYKNSISNNQNDNVESVANILPRQKIFRDVFNSKAESTSSNPPAVSPYKTLENLRRDIIEKMLPKFNSTNQFIFVLSTTQSPRNNVVARGNIRSYEHFESSTESEPLPTTTHRPKLFTNLYRYQTTTTTELPTTVMTSTESTSTEATTAPVLLEETTTTTLKPTTTSAKYDYFNRNRNVYISSEAKAFSSPNKDRPIASAYTSRGSLRRSDDDVDVILESPEPDRPTYSRLSAPITFEALKSKTRNPYRIIDDISNRVDSRPQAPRLLGGFLSNNDDDNAIETVSELTTDPYDYNDFEDTSSTTSSTTTTERTTTTTSTSTTTTPPPPPSVEPPVAVRSRPTATTRRSYPSNKCTDNNSLQQKCDNNLSQRYKQPLPPFTHPKNTSLSHMFKKKRTLCCIQQRSNQSFLICHLPPLLASIHTL